ncbi:LysM peptidoglycan-binding domain-containing protein [Pseudoflavonifractor capillosus]|uniref:LysM peptidoglycan-binding domain-containing protein n=1 Tax=Pseudoflavonifractor capillosus TaxID=106588 RepID=A0A921SS02_9FIRM|nr:LysM peptidoglycan-binding domain-containing protein [Pseudoflavonifractor capillosus]HJG86435.1 LysM peptidoglycan-binding domain-containing protein [Pseudoflavonifractor capillosus]
MVIHVVAPGDTLFSIAEAYGVPFSLLAIDNGLSAPYQLAVGQALVVQFPRLAHTVRPGETTSAIAAQYGISLRQLLRNNPVLGGNTLIYPGQTLVIAFQGEKLGALTVNGYAYPFIGQREIQALLPYLTYLTPFTYGITSQGKLIPPDDSTLISTALQSGTAPLLHLSTLAEEGGFSNELASLVLNDMAVQDALIDNLEETVLERGYQGLDVDFEFVFPQGAGAYADFLGRLSAHFNPMGYPVIAALAPKTSADQKGQLYEGHNYRAIGEAVNRAFLMTYEWGYTYGPPMAVAPLPNVQQVVEYALTEIPAEKLWLGIPNYGYDWTLPFVQGESRARSLSSQEAVALAIRYSAEIQYSVQAQSPFFYYTDEGAAAHVVWFEDARSIRAKLALVPRYGLSGVGYWNLMRAFPQNWRVLNALYDILDP